MGCISSKADINDIHHNIFQVMNVDDLGNRLNPGQLEITDTDLVLHQRRKAPVKWPLRCLRRYGFDAELFSFESGRRCPTGAGIYAFRCQRAEQLFNLLQTHIQVRNNTGEDGVSRDFPVPSAPRHAVSQRGSSSGDSNYLDPVHMRTTNRMTSGSSRFISQNGVLSRRLDSVGSSSNGPLSPHGTTSPSPPPILVQNAAVISSVSSSNPSVHYANEELFSTSTTTTDPSENNNKECMRQSLPSSVTISLSNDSFMREKPVSRLSVCSGDGIALLSLSDSSAAMASYVNVDLSNGPLSPSCSIEEDSNFTHLSVPGDTQPVYMNLIPGPENGRLPAPDMSAPLRVKSAGVSCGKLLSSQDWEVDDSKRCYANLQHGDIEMSCNVTANRIIGNERYFPPVSSLSPNQPVDLVPPKNMKRQVNYIVLDLEQNKMEMGGFSSVSPLQPQSTSPIGSVSLSVLPVPSESRVPEGYATIDFNKTVALSHSVNPNMSNDSEGSRKTRHNSTINDLYLCSIRHSSSD